MSRELTQLEKSLIENINKKFGKDNPMEQLSEESEYGKPKGFVDTGIYSLNWLISGSFNGGWPVGRISELLGDPSTGKSLLCEMAIKDPTISLPIYFDTEAAINVDFLKFLGIQYDKILYQPIDTVEQLTDSLQEILNTIIMNKSDKRILAIIDSIALASTLKEMDPEGGQDMGYKAREIRKFFRMYARKISKHNMALLVTNHYTQTIGKSYGPSKVSTGGSGLPYAASVRVDLKIEELEIDKKIESLGASAVTIQATTIKNRCFSPKRKINFILDFERGVNRYSGLTKILLDFGICQKSGGWYQFPDWDKDKKFYAKDFPEIIEKNNLMGLIQEKLNAVVSDKDHKVNDEIEGEVVDELKENEEKEASEDVARKLRRKRNKD
jgi:recombination protein RecA